MSHSPTVSQGLVLTAHCTLLSSLHTLHHFYFLPILPPSPPPSSPACPPPCVYPTPLRRGAFSLQHLSLIWNEEEMPPYGLTSGPSWGLAEIDACDPAVLIYSPRPQGSGRLHCAFLERMLDRQAKKRKWGGEGQRMGCRVADRALWLLH